VVLSMIEKSPLGQTCFPMKSFKDDCAFLSGYAFSSKDMGDSGYPVIKIKNIQNRRVSVVGSQFVHASTVTSKLDKYKLENLDILIAMTGQGSVGRVGRLDLDSDITAYLNQRVGKFIPNEINLNADFLYYILSSEQYERVLFSAGSGSGQPNLSPTIIQSIEIPYPPYKLQCEIGKFLRLLDDKIENNRRMNETLEKMARAIFKSWFVDFDPVHAKTVGNAPAHMDADTAALFPSSFGDDGLPVGFNSKTLKDGDTELESGKRPKGGIDKSLHEGIPSIGAESLQKIGDFEYSKVKFVGKEFAEKSSKGWVQNYDVAIYKDGANVGDPTRVGLFGNGFPFDKFMVNEHVFLLRSKELGQPFLYSLCQSEKLSHQLKSMGTSKAAQPGLNQQEVLSCEYIAPPQVLLSAFNKKVSPFIDRRLALGLENQTLAELRDTLLPKLMSGEIRVKDAEQEVETVI
jgi:type I restriction enzyme, S subunit